jgi:hypothetical protein
VPVIEAIASDGIGVVDTFVAAVRAAVRAIQARVDAGDVRVPVQLAETAETALAHLSNEAVDPEWAVEMMLEEASNAFVLAQAFDEERDSDDDPPTWRPNRQACVAKFPTEHVPTGFVWPAHTGRAALRALAGDEKLKVPVALDGEGTVRVVVGDFVLATAKDRRFESSEAARQALVRAARDRTQLGSLLAPETVLVVQPESDASWLWTILPRVPSVVDLVTRDRAEPGALLGRFGAALAEALKLQASLGLTLDLSPRAFGLRNGALRYLGDVAGDAAGRDVGSALVESFAALVALGVEIDAAVAALESAIAARLSHEERAALARASTWPTAPAFDAARARIERALRRGEAA